MSNRWPFALPETQGPLRQNRTVTPTNEVKATKPGLSIWIWIILVIGLIFLLAVVALIIFFVGRSQKSDQLMGETLMYSDMPGSQRHPI